MANIPKWIIEARSRLKKIEDELKSEKRRRREAYQNSQNAARYVKKVDDGIKQLEKKRDVLKTLIKAGLVRNT